jgi:hypothetical protein
LGDPRRLADQDDQQAGGHGIERTGVTDTLHFQFAAEPRDDVMRRMVPGFVHEEDALHFLRWYQHVV